MAQGQNKLDPLHYSLVLSDRFLGALPLLLSRFSRWLRSRDREAACCTAPHAGFPPDLIFPVCSSMVIHFPWAQSQEPGRTQTLVWAPVFTQAGEEERVGRQTHGWAHTTSVACEVRPFYIYSRINDLSEHQQQRLRSAQKSFLLPWTPAPSSPAMVLWLTKAERNWNTISLIVIVNCVNLARPWYWDIWANDIPDVSVKAYFRWD